MGSLMVRTCLGVSALGRGGCVSMRSLSIAGYTITVLHFCSVLFPYTSALSCNVPTL